MDSDLWRAQHTALISASSGPTAAFEPLQVDLIPTPLNGEHHVVTNLSAFGTFSTNPIIAGARSALSGIFMINANEPIESLADAVAGFNQNARGHRIGGDWNVEQAGAVFAFAYVVQLTNPLILPYGYTLRFICVPNPGTATPGPGPGSVAFLSAAVVSELNQ